MRQICTGKNIRLLKHEKNTTKHTDTHTLVAATQHVRLDPPSTTSDLNVVALTCGITQHLATPPLTHAAVLKSAHAAHPRSSRGACSIASPVASHNSHPKTIKKKKHPDQLPLLRTTIPVSNTTLKNEPYTKAHNTHGQPCTYLLVCNNYNARAPLQSGSHRPIHLYLHSSTQ